MNKKITKGIGLLTKIRHAAEEAMDEGNMDRFIHYAFRWTSVHLAVFPGDVMGPGHLLNRILEDRVFNSQF